LAAKIRSILYIQTGRGVIGMDIITEVSKQIDRIEEVEKFNPYHDERGRFASANSYAFFSTRTKDPAKQHMADAAVAREKERYAATQAAQPQKHINGSTVSISRSEAFDRLDAMDEDYTPYAMGYVSRTDAGQLYKAVKNDRVKALPETISMMYNETKAPLRLAWESYSQDFRFYEDVYHTTKALLNGDFEVAQFFINEIETDSIRRAGKRSPYFKYQKQLGDE